MRFKTKMVLIYAMFMVVVAFILGLGFYKYSERQYEKTEEQNLKIEANQLVEQLDHILSSMELTMNYILSDPNMLSSIRMLAKTPEDGAKNRFVEEAKMNISKGINTDYITKHFYRTIMFNKTGSAISTGSSKSGNIKTKIDYKTMPWLSMAENAKGKPIIINSHEDTWGLKNNVQVFSLLMAVQGYNMGYIEVQYRIQDLVKQLQLSKEGLKFIIFIKPNEILCSNLEETEHQQFKDLAYREGALEKNIKSINTNKILAVRGKSNSYDVDVLVIENKETINKESTFITYMTLGIASAFFGISMIFIIISSQFLTNPIRHLREIMENTHMENMGDKVFLETPNNEIEALKISYQNVLERLKGSIIKEKKASLLQIQAQFDALQSQINPHFLYNVLNVISARGMSTGDEQICEMCGSLAMMLRYSTNNKNRYATIKEEIEYLNQYLYLIKSRYEHKIEFCVNVDESIQEQIIPKIILQQIVENSINHGFKNSAEQMQCNIYGWREDEYWYIKIRDNGQGFEEKTLSAITEKLEKTKSRVLKEGSSIEMEIGGMGLVNTYARLLLLYNDDLFFQIKNMPDGAEVVIGARMKPNI